MAFNFCDIRYVKILIIPIVRLKLFLPIKLKTFQLLFILLFYLKYNFNKYYILNHILIEILFIFQRYFYVKRPIENLKNLLSNILIFPI